jgi:hypothetical protein
VRDIASLWSNGIQLIEHGSESVTAHSLGDEVLGISRHGWFGREGHVPRVHNDVFPQNTFLAAPLAKGPLAKQHLKQDDSHRPHIHLLHVNTSRRQCHDYIYPLA